MTAWGLQWLSGVRERLRQRRDLLLEFIVLRHQLAVLQRTGTRRPCFRTRERLFWVFLSRWWANWQRSLIIVQPATVLRWRRRGFWAIWMSGSCGRWRGGRPRISNEMRALIVRMSQENFLWGAPRIRGELLKLGFDVSQATVSRYMPRRSYPPSQSWRTFLRNQALGIGTISLGEAGRISDQLLAFVRWSQHDWIERIVRCAAKVWDGICCWPTRPQPTFPHSNHRAIYGRRLLGGPRRIAEDGRCWTWVGRRTAPYRSRASPTVKLPAFTNLARSSSRCARGGANSNCAEGRHAATRNRLTAAPTKQQTSEPTP